MMSRQLSGKKNRLKIEGQFTVGKKHKKGLIIFEKNFFYIFRLQNSIFASTFHLDTCTENEIEFSRYNSNC